MAEHAQEAERMRADLALGVAVGAVGAEVAVPDVVEDGFGDDGAGRVAGAEEQDAEGCSIGRGYTGSMTAR